MLQSKVNAESSQPCISLKKKRKAQVINTVKLDWEICWCNKSWKRPSVIDKYSISNYFHWFLFQLFLKLWIENHSVYVDVVSVISPMCFWGTILLSVTCLIQKCAKRWRSFTVGGAEWRTVAGCHSKAPTPLVMYHDFIVYSVLARVSLSRLPSWTPSLLWLVGSRMPDPDPLTTTEQLF